METFSKSCERPGYGHRLRQEGDAIRRRKRRVAGRGREQRPAFTLRKSEPRRHPGKRPGVAIGGIVGEDGQAEGRKPTRIAIGADRHGANLGMQAFDRMRDQRPASQVDQSLVDAHASRFPAGKNETENRLFCPQAIFLFDLGASADADLRENAPQFGAGSTI